VKEQIATKERAYILAAAAIALICEVGCLEHVWNK
jgi:hypothetical protein